MLARFGLFRPRALGLLFVEALSSSSRPSTSAIASAAAAAERRVIRFPPTRTPGYGVNTHRSNRAKNGLYHGKDIQFGHSVSHSQVKSKRRWYPNVINKRVWSDALDEWVRFKMTTRALREIDNIGGIDNYLLALEEPQVVASNYVTKMRGLIATSLFHKGLLSKTHTRRLGFDRVPPSPTIVVLKDKEDSSNIGQAHLT